MCLSPSHRMQNCTLSILDLEVSLTYYTMQLPLFHVLTSPGPSPTADPALQL